MKSSSPESAEFSQFKRGTGWGGEVTKGCKVGQMAVLHKFRGAPFTLQSMIEAAPLELCDSVTKRS